jgi:alpha/beta superfamily hydrolase
MQPVFINGDAGRLFAIYWPPDGEVALGKSIIHIPAFAEEINKTRGMVAMQARAFAKQGYAVLVVDLFGTGDVRVILAKPLGTFG